jgi:arylsulfatase A-like enzyme
LTAGAAPFFLRGRAAAVEQPDIVVLLTSDVRAGDEIALPQTLQRIAGNGTTFPNFFLTTTLCCPSRASIFTGLYAHNHGVHDNHDGWEGFAKRGNRERTTGVLLQAAGYQTAAIGVYLNGAQPGRGKEPGWDIGPVAGGRKKKRKGGKGHGGHGGNSRNPRRNRRQRKGGSSGGDARLVDAAASIIAEALPDEPLYLHVGFGTAHVPVNPTPPYAGQFAAAQVDRDPSFDEENVADKPKYIRDLPRLSASDEAWLDRLHRGRLEELLALDDGIVKIWDALEARGRLDNTYIFLLSDNAMSLGHHRIYGKMVPYDTSIRAPLFAFGPEFAQGLVDDRLVGNIDIAPTLVEVAGASAPQMDGRSLLDAQERDAMLLELLGEDLHSMDWPGPRADIPRFSALRTATHLYTEYRTGEHELYDYASDPYELQNLLAGDPPAEVEQLATTLAARLDELRGCRAGDCL